MKRDAIIIGSGLAGMTAAVALAQEGLNVLVLEQAAAPGGLMQRFTRGGLAFPTGIHAVGMLDPGQLLRRCWEALGLVERLDLARMEAEGFAECRFPGLTFRVPMGHEAFRARLIERFPQERRAIDAFLADLRATVVQFPLYHAEAGPEGPLTETQCGSLKAYLDTLTSDADLKLVLSGLNLFYGMPPSECPVYVHFLVLDSFLQSAWRIDERRRPLAEAFAERLKELGGACRVGARAVEIECASGEVRAVRLADGERLEAARVIYTGHPQRLPALCADSALRPAFRQRLRDQPETTGFFGLAVEWRGACPLERCDAFVYRSRDLERPYRQRLLDGEAPDLVYWSGSPARGAAAAAVTALAFSAPEEWARWGASRTGARPAEYRAAKAAAAERTLGLLHAQWPGAEARLRETFTPLTFRDYTGTPAGGGYGIKKCVSVTRAGRLAAETRVRGLFLAGQSVVLPGVVGTTISSLGACGAILGSQRLVERLLRTGD